MTLVNLSETLATRLQKLALRQRRSIDEVLEELLDRYEPSSEDSLPPPPEGETDPFADLIGFLDEFVTDETDTNLSETVRETLAKHTHPQYGWTKPGRTD